MAGKSKKIAAGIKRKKVKQETSKGEQERLLVKAKIKKTLKNVHQKLVRKYGKNWRSNIKDSNDPTLNDPSYKEIVDCLYKLGKLETAPKRFKDLTTHLKKQKNLNIAPNDLETIYIALELAENHQKQADEIFRLQSKIVFPMVKGFAVEKKEGREKGVRAFAKASGFKRKRPGKQSKWNKESEKELTERWDSLDDGIDENSNKEAKRNQRLHFYEILKNEFGFPSSSAVEQKLRALGVKGIPDAKYHPTK